MRQVYTFTHTPGAIGMIGAMSGLLVLLHHLPEPQALGDYARLRIAMGDNDETLSVEAIVERVGFGQRGF